MCVLLLNQELQLTAEIGAQLYEVRTSYSRSTTPLIPSNFLFLNYQTNFILHPCTGGGWPRARPQREGEEGREGLVGAGESPPIGEPAGRPAAAEPHDSERGRAGGDSPESEIHRVDP
jgi:hypothetical protein